MDDVQLKGGNKQRSFKRKGIGYLKAKNERYGKDSLVVQVGNDQVGVGFKDSLQY